MKCFCFGIYLEKEVRGNLEKFFVLIINLLKVNKVDFKFID